MTKQTSTEATSEAVEMAAFQPIIAISASGMIGEIDLRKFTQQQLADIVNQTVRVTVQRCTAGMGEATTKEKQDRMQEKFNEFVNATYQAGGGGGKGGARITDKVQAERNVLAVRFMSEGYSKTKAEAAAKGSDAWHDYFLLAMSRSQNRTNVTKEEVAAAIEANQALIDNLIAEELKLIEASKQSVKAAGFDFAAMPKA